MLETRLLSSLAKIFPDEISGESLPQTLAMRNEPLSFQIAYRSSRLDRKDLPFYIQIESDLDLKNLASYKEGYVPVVHAATLEPDDYYDRTRPGLYPDPLFLRNSEITVADDGFWSPRFFEQNEKNILSTAVSDSYQALWFTVNEDGKELPEGGHFVKVVFHRASDGEVLSTVEYRFTIIGTDLHEQDLEYTSWFYADCLADTYGVEVFSHRHFEIMKSFIAAAARTGMTMLLLPAFTPPLDTPVGRERRTVQLVRVTKTDDKYSFDFTLMKRYMEMCRECGISHFEHSHLYTQWGARHAPKIIATVDGAERQIFGWDTDSAGREYCDFLKAYLCSLKSFLEENHIDKGDVLFHISDEPMKEHLAYYAKAVETVRSQIRGFRCGDALSHYEFYEKGYVEMPIVVHASEEMDKIMENCDKFWVYYTGLQATGGFSNRLLATTSARNRILGIQMYVAGAKGFLHWGYNYYYGELSHGLFNPFSDPCGSSKMAGTSYLVYPGTDGTAVISLRMKVLHEAFIDYRALQTLEGFIGREKVLAYLEQNFGKIAFSTCFSGKRLLEIREAINRKILECMSAK